MTTPSLAPISPGDAREPGSPGEPLGKLSAYLAFIRRITGADAVQLVDYSSGTRIIADNAPSSEISANLLTTAGDPPGSANGARTIINTYRFAGRLVHLAASDCGFGQWLLVWFRLPEGETPENITGITELAAIALPERTGTQKKIQTSEHAVDHIDFAAPRSKQLRQLCRWLAKTADVTEVFLVRKRLANWRISSASGQLPTRTGPLAHAVAHALRQRSEGAGLEEIKRLSGQPSAKVFQLGPRHAVVMTGQSVTPSPETLQTVTRLLLLLDPVSPLIHDLSQRWHGHPASRRKMLLIGSAVLVLILLLPVHQRVRTDVILQPSIRRFIAAPFNGVVKKVHVRSGDIVQPGELLVELDGREIGEKLDDVTARLSSAALQNTTELESSNYSQASMRALDAEGLTHERDLLRYQQKNLNLYAPMRSVIVTGELERSEGAAVELGKPLLELAPLDTMVAEIAVTENDVAIVQKDMEVAVKLNALPDQTFYKTITKVAPRSETRDGRNVFVAEAELTNKNDLLRPGMKGHAVIYSWRAPLAWTLIRKPWQVMQRWLFR